MATGQLVNSFGSDVLEDILVDHVVWQGDFEIGYVGHRSGDRLLGIAVAGPRSSGHL